MADKLEFQRDPNRGKRKTNPVKNTTISTPKETFDLEKFTSSQRDKAKEVAKEMKVGRPKQNKKYTTARLQKNTVNELNATQNTLGFDTQDELVIAMLELMRKDFSSDQLTMFEMYMKTYKARDAKKG
ncbi:Replication-associated protein RepC [Enterococcus sp. DIV0800]|uniref:Replication-associated protein RepC n=1 Tax=unclassified Enterococcus TaxID=2608891 RepID=UPI003D2FA9BB